MPDYSDYLDDLQEELKHFEREPLAPASAEDIEAFAQKVKEASGLDLPEQYLEFLGEANGFNFNGVFIYMIDTDDLDSQKLPSFLSENMVVEGLSGKEDRWFYFGHSDLWFYAYNPADSTYHALDRESLSSAQEFEDFDDMMCGALEEALELFDEEEQEEGDDE